MQNATNLIWIDMEMTGLNPEIDRVLEIACIVTDKELNEVATGPVLAVYQPEEMLKNMNEWCQEHHSQSGLLDRVRKEGVSEAEAESKMLAFLSEYVPPKSSPICGNSIGQDRRFLYKYMPNLEAYFHYRYLDVSSFKIVANLWRPEIMVDLKKKEAHLALDDIRESIEELKYYRRHLLK